MLDTACQALIPIIEEIIQCDIIEHICSRIGCNCYFPTGFQRSFQIHFRRSVHKIIVVVVARIPNALRAEIGRSLHFPLGISRIIFTCQIVIRILNDIRFVTLCQDMSGKTTEQQRVYEQAPNPFRRTTTILESFHRYMDIEYFHLTLLYCTFYCVTPLTITFVFPVTSPMLPPPYTLPYTLD